MRGFALFWEGLACVFAVSFFLVNHTIHGVELQPVYKLRSRP